MTIFELVQQVVDVKELHPHYAADTDVRIAIEGNTYDIEGVDYDYILDMFIVEAA